MIAPFGVLITLLRVVIVLRRILVVAVSALAAASAEKVSGTITLASKWFPRLRVGWVENLWTQGTLPVVQEGGYYAATS